MLQIFMCERIRLLVNRITVLTINFYADRFYMNCFVIALYDFNCSSHFFNFSECIIQSMLCVCGKRSMNDANFQEASLCCIMNRSVIVSFYKNIFKTF